MQDLVDRISAATGLEPDMASKGLGIVLDYIQKTVTPDASAPVIDAIPGGRMAAAGAAEDEAEGGGTARPGIDGLVDRLAAEGIGVSSLPILSRILAEDVRSALGDRAADAVSTALPEQWPPREDQTPSDALT